jgi:hypothetical protein
MRRRRPIGLIAAVVAAAGCGATTGTSGVGGSCAGPLPTVAPTAAAAGERVSFSVEWLHSGCRDTNPGTEVDKPLLDVPVEVAQGSLHAVVGTVSGRGERFRGVLWFPLPAWVRPGPAELLLDGPVVQRLPFTVLPPR